MRCRLCGTEYAGFHVCRAAAPAEETPARAPSPPLRFAPVHYLREALAIARWDEAAIQRAARDNNALVYGFVFWTLGIFAPILRNLLLAWLAGYRIPWLTVAGELAKTLAVMATLMLVYFGIFHLLARFLLNGQGSYGGILRAMLLGSVVLWLGVIPVIGEIVARLWWGIAILMWVFEEVEGIERLQALAISIGIPLGLGLLGWILGWFAG